MRRRQVQVFHCTLRFWLRVTKPCIPCKIFRRSRSRVHACKSGSPVKAAAHASFAGSRFAYWVSLHIGCCTYRLSAPGACRLCWHLKLLLLLVRRALPVASATTCFIHPSVIDGSVSFCLLGVCCFGDWGSTRDAKRNSCYAALAQAGLLLAAASLLPCSCVPIALRALSDNSGAESGLYNLLTTSRPLAFFLARVSLLAAILRMSQAVSRIPRAATAKAATLSCPAEYALPPAPLPHAEIRTCLQELWLPRPTISVSPPSSQLQWQVRARGMPTNLT